MYRVCFLPFARTKVKQNSFLRIFVYAKISPEYQLLPNLQQSLSYLKNWASLSIKLMFKHVSCVLIIFHFKENYLKSGFHHITTRQLFDFIFSVLLTSFLKKNLTEENYLCIIYLLVHLDKTLIVCHPLR